MKRDKVYIDHILEAIITVDEHLGDINFEEFLQNKLIQDGVMRELEIIGEASNNISSGFKNSHQDIPWSDIISMRNKLIHEYFGVDLKEVWHTATKDIPKLKEEIQKISSIK